MRPSFWDDGLSYLASLSGGLGWVLCNYLGSACGVLLFLSPFLLRGVRIALATVLV